MVRAPRVIKIVFSWQDHPDRTAEECEAHYRAVHMELAKRSFRMAALFGVFSTAGVITLGDALGFERLDDADVRKSPRRAASQRERDLGRGGRRGGLVRQIRARRQKSEERDRGGTEHGGTLRETVPVRAGIFRLSSKKDREFLRVRAAKCAVCGVFRVAEPS